MREIERLALLCTAAHLPPPEAWAERAQSVEEAGSTEVVADGVMERADDVTALLPAHLAPVA